MHDSEFIKEVQKSSLYYEGFEHEYDVFKEYQKITLQTLKEVQRVCELGSINYQLAFGSLLGAIRDDGQIPWDYDVDIIVPSEERAALVKALKKELSRNFHFYSIEEDRSCEHVILRVAPKEYDTHFLHVDVFFVAGLPQSQDEAHSVKEKLSELSFYYKAKKFNFFDRKTNSKREALKMLEYRVKGIFKSEISIWKEYQGLSCKYKICDSSKCCLADRFSGWYDFSTSMITDTIQYQTSMGSFRIPREYDEVLRLEYGQYQDIPPLSNRLNEFKRHYNFLIKNCPIKNIDI